MRANRLPQTQAELKSQLDEQLAFLQASAGAFDKGFASEAKRLAVVIRVLLFDRGSSKSLLGQLGRKNILFFDTALDHNPRNLLPHAGLVGLQVGPGGAKYVALLGGSPRGRGTPTPFRRWWEKVIFVDNQNEELTREQLILTAANQDGGAHVDPTLDEAYARLSRQNALGWVASSPNGEFPLEGAHLCAIRQIAFEVVTSIEAGLTATDDPTAGRTSVPGRNEPCFCGSGKKYKRCHGTSTT